MDFHWSHGMSQSKTSEVVGKLIFEPVISTGSPMIAVSVDDHAHALRRQGEGNRLSDIAS